MSVIASTVEHHEEHPLYRDILKSILKSQIQLLVDQLADKIGEETVVLTANLDSGSITDIGTECGRDFIEGHNDIKSQFMGFCINRHFSKLADESKSTSQNKSTTQKSSKAIKSLLEALPNKSTSLKPTDHKKKQKPGYTDVKIVNGTIEGVPSTVHEMNVCEGEDNQGEHAKLEVNPNGTIEGVPTTVNEMNDESIKDSVDGNQRENSKTEGNSKRKQVPSPSTNAPVLDNQSLNSVDPKPSRRKQKPPKRLKTNHIDNDTLTTKFTNDSDDSNFPIAFSEEELIRLAHVNRAGSKDNEAKYHNSDVDVEGYESPASIDNKVLWGTNLVNNNKQPINNTDEDVSMPGVSSNNDSVSPDMDYSMFNMISNSSLAINHLGKGDSDVRTGSIIKTENLGKNENLGSIENNLYASIDSQLKERALMKYDSSDLPYQFTTPTLSREEVEAMSKVAQNQNIETNRMSPSSLFGKKQAAPGSSKNPVCGLLVSRGQGRLEKMLKCEECGKVCRTSNMSRHKKRYCLGYQKVKLVFPK